MSKIVKFKNGKFGVRRRAFLCFGWEYLDMQGGARWKEEYWPSKHLYKNPTWVMTDSQEHAAKRLQESIGSRHIDYGTPVNPPKGGENE